MDKSKITRITDVVTETKDVKTLMFENPEKVIQGQFFMIWIPGVDEIPMSVSYTGGKIKGITFRQVGEATKALSKMMPGDKIGVRGPYGNGFKLDGKKILFIGGGTGVATVAPAVERAVSKNIEATVILGFKNKDEIFFENRLKKTDSKVYVSTDDGSKGFKGFASNLAEEVIGKEDFDAVITCGPEKMMKKLFDLCRDIPFQASLERYMKCGIGICGQCCVGEGLRICVEGPVLHGEMLKKVEDFGVFKRNASGKKTRF